jgi:hypothetical protein
MMDMIRAKLATAWIIPLAFLLPSILLSLSIWRQISRYRRYKTPQYYDEETMRNMV